MPVVRYCLSVYCITAPSVSIIPPVMALLPSDIRVTLQCKTNNPSLPVQWLSSLADAQPLSTQASYTLSVPSQGGFLDGRSFYCVVRDPEVDSSSANNIILGSAVTRVQNVEGIIVKLI